MKKTKILATYGPAISAQGTLKALISAGVNAFRVNCAHGKTQDFLAAARKIRAAAEDSRWPIGLLFDIAGPKLRLAHFDGKIDVTRGKKIWLRYGRTDPAKGIVGVNTKAVIAAARKGQKLYIDDGTLLFVVVQADRGKILIRAENAGTLLPSKGINLPDTKLKVPTIGEKDREDIKTAVRVDADYIALSFVRSANDILEAKKLIKKLGGRQQVLAKLEKREAIDQLEAIMDAADGVMVARGDLGVELPPAEVPKLQKKITRMANQRHKLVIVATQMLESMRFSPRATRAEVNDVASAVFDYVDAVMLSAETATGRYPLETVKTMDTVISTTESSMEMPDVQIYEHLVGSAIPQAVAEAVGKAVRSCETRCIVAFTTSGFTADLISNLFPDQPVIALTPSPKVLTRLSLPRGVYPVMVEQPKTIEDMLTTVNSVVKKLRLARKGQRVVVTGGAPFGTTPYTNFLLIHKVL